MTSYNTDMLGAKAPSSIRSLFDRVLASIDKVSFVLIIISMGMMVSLVTGQVFTRYIMSSSIDSADELSRLFFVWVMFLAIPHGIKSGIHVGIDAVVVKLPGAVRAMVARFTALLSAILMGVLFWLAITSVGDKWQELMPTVELTSAVFYIAILFCAGHSLLHLVALIFPEDKK